MAVSPWKKFPITFPIAGDHVMCRMRSWDRQPFFAVWHDGSEWKGEAGVSDAAWSETGQRVPWWALDAWRPA